MDFDKILINKIRFEYKGVLSLEDLYSLSLEQLNQLYIKYNEQITKNGLKKESLTQTKREIVRHVFEYKQQLINKENEELTNKTKEELEKMLDNL